MAMQEKWVSRYWMYRQHMTTEFREGVNEFLNFAKSHATTGSFHIRCPCSKCANLLLHDIETVRGHLCTNGFTPNYYHWFCHGESTDRFGTAPSFMQNFSSMHGHNHSNSQQRTVSHGFRPENVSNSDQQLQMQQFRNSFGQNDVPSSSNNATRSLFHGPRNLNVKVYEEKALTDKFWDVLRVANEPLWEGCVNQTQLKTISMLLNFKSKYNLPKAGYNQLIQSVGDILPRDHTLPRDYSETKKLVEELGLPVREIDICPTGCMLYWKDDISKDACRFCNHPRYKPKKGSLLSPYKQLHYLPLIPRLQRLYASRTTAENMKWHAEHETEEGTMSHPSDSEAWKHLDRTHPDFASELRNVRLGLSVSSYTPIGALRNTYYCLPIIVTPYNLPPSMCLKASNMFLTMIVPGSYSPEKLIDVCLQPLIEELSVLWFQGVQTYDISQNQSFIMRAALLWTINDFWAYSMLSGWNTTGVMGCPICMEDSNAFMLEYSKKASWFDCHRRFLPKDHPFRRDKNAFYKGRSVKSSAPRCLTGSQIWHRVNRFPTVVEDPHSIIKGYETQHKWIKQSIFWQLPYWETLLIRHNFEVLHVENYVFDKIFNTVMDINRKSADTINARKDMKLYCNRAELQVDENHRGPKPKAVYTLSRDQRKQICEWVKCLRFPDGYAPRVSGMSCHSCHMFLQRLVPIVFREMLPDFVWGPLTELSQLFQSLCSPTLSLAQMQELESAAPLILCKLERIFPPSFFDLMEHMVVHLPYAAKVGGPIQYRWVYPFERFLYQLKGKVGKKEENIEASLCSTYISEELSFLADHYFESHVISRAKRSRRNDENDCHEFSIFNYPGNGCGRSCTRCLSEEEKHAAETFVLLNCDEVASLISIFEEQIGTTDEYFDKQFTPWFKSYVLNSENNVQDELLKSLAHGPNSRVQSWSAYMINGYTFHTLEFGEGKSTMNSGVLIEVSEYHEKQPHCYGLVEEIIQLEYPGNPTKRVVLFKCRWFCQDEGTRVHQSYNLVEINQKVLSEKFQPIVLAQQAIQVYYAEYPGARQDRADWWAVCRTSPRTATDEYCKDGEDAYQPGEVKVPIVEDVAPAYLRDPSGAFVSMDDDGTNGTGFEDLDEF